MNNVLFIGGVADGKIRQNPHSETWVMAGEFPIHSWDDIGPTPAKLERKESVYRREIIRSEREEIVFYVERSITTCQAIIRLMHNYSP